MDIGWNFRREHLRLSQRSHSVIVDGGDQPNVVPRTASVWYYFREIDYPHIKEMWETGDTMAKAAAMMAGVELLPTKVLGRRWPQHFNKVVAETTWANIQKVGMPQWDEDDQTAREGAAERTEEPAGRGLDDRSCGEQLQGPVTQNNGGGSDDIGDVSWNVPTVTLRYPANIPGLPGHNWANAIAMATPIAHKGVTAGAKVQAMTILDLVMRPELVQQAWTYFRDVQTKDTKYEPLIRAAGSAGDLVEQGDDGQVPAGDEEVLLRSDRGTRPTSNSSASSTRWSRSSGTRRERAPRVDPRGNALG